MKITLLQNTPNDALLAVAKYMKKVRLDQEKTLDELAVKVGVSRSTLIRLEKTGAGSTGTMIKVFAALGVLDNFVSALVLPEKQLTIAELKKMSSPHQRQRGRRRPRELS